MNITRSIRKFIRSKSMSLIIVAVVVACLFYVINHNYLGKDNIRGILNSMSISGILAIGMAFLLMGGGINLAAGAEGCFGALIVTMTMKAGVPWPLAIVVGVVFGTCTGLLNSFFINKLNFMGFISTLGMASVYTGLGLVISSNTNVPVSDESFLVLGTTSLFGFLPTPFIIMLCLLIIYGFILNKTRFGRSILMCGGNRTAARLAGLNPKRISTILYINCGILATIAGSVLAARMRSASPSALSSGALDAITASVLGGVSFMGGGGSMAGVFFGLLLLCMFNNGLLVIELSAYWQIVAQGMLLIIALCVDFYSAKARAVSLRKASMRKTA